MPIIDNASREVFALPGLKHQTLASASDQLAQLEVWSQTLEPDAATPVHYHECEEVIVILKGTGNLSVGDESTEFGPGTTLTIAPRSLHLLTNSGKETMHLIAVLSETPGRVFAPDGSIMALPWS